MTQNQGDVAPSAKPLDHHLREFKQDGLTILPALFAQSWVHDVREAFAELQVRIPTVDGKRPEVFVDFLEAKPELVLPAVTNERLLDFAEMLVGPHVQLESVTFRRTARQSTAEPPVLGYHRDMFAFYPDEGVYHRPLLFNALCYLQDLTDATGPLRVVPGSHMRAIGVSDGQLRQPHPQEVLLYPKAGDVLVFHNSVLHSGSVNLSDDYRYLFFMTLNHSWLKHRANYAGPASQALINWARSRNDKRLLRLLGVGGLEHANSGFQEPDEVRWERPADRHPPRLPDERYAGWMKVQHAT